VCMCLCVPCVDPQLLVLRASIPVDGTGRYANVDIIVGDAIMYKPVPSCGVLDMCIV